MTRVGAVLAVGAVERRTARCAGRCRAGRAARRADAAAVVASASSQEAVDAAAWPSIGGSPGQYSSRQSSSLQSPDSSRDRPGVEPGLVSVGGEKWCRRSDEVRVAVQPRRRTGRTSRCRAARPCRSRGTRARRRPSSRGGSGTRWSACRRRYRVDDLDARDHLDGERQRGPPAVSRAVSVLEVVAGGGGVVDPGQRADVVVHLVQQVRLDAAGEVEEAAGDRATVRRRRGSTARRDAGAEQSTSRTASRSATRPAVPRGR